MFLAIPLLALASAVTAAPSQPGASGKFVEIARQADAARTADRMGEAIGLYREGVRLRPSWTQGWWWLGTLFYDQDRFPEAEAALTRFVAITPKPGPGYAMLALCEYETQDYTHSLKHFEDWARGRSPGTDDLGDVAAFHWALLLTRKGRFEQALFLLGGRARRRGETPALIEALGLASLHLARLPQEAPPDWRERVWLAGKAAFYAAVSNFEGSDEYSSRLLAHYSQAPNVHYFVGTLFAAEHKSAEADAEFRQELQISAQHVPAMLALAEAELGGYHLAEAETLAKRATEIEPANPAVHHLLGRILLAAGRAQQGVVELELAKRLDPELPSIRFHLASAYRQLGRKQDAARELAAYSALQKKDADPSGLGSAESPRGDEDGPRR
jgi:tetratricopeptide (TPR) repeat protein